ncbi:MAG: hypothetical protein QM755_14475 [Luteolibacter sp.]
MKKNRTPLHAGHSHEHAGLINYLALMHAISHPETAEIGGR